MTKIHTFIIESDGTKHELLLDGESVATFSTLDAAEAEANRIANYATPGSSLRFELDLKSTMIDLEIRGATLEVDVPAGVEV